MFNKLRPDFYFDSIFDIDLDFLENNSIRGILLDIDNTIAVTGKKETEDSIKEHLLKLKEHGIKILLLTNAGHDRVKNFDMKEYFPYICISLKPFKRSYKIALRILGINAGESVMVGDQIFTDIYGGNRMKMKTVLLKPITKSNEYFFVRLKRNIERLILKQR